MKHSTSHLIFFAAGPSRRWSLPVELPGRLSPREPFLEFENGSRIQSLDVSSEIDQTLPVGEAFGEAAQSAWKAGPLAHERATDHMVATWLKSRGSAASGNLAVRMPDGSPCDNERTACAQRPAHRRFGLVNKMDLRRVLVLELTPPQRRNAQAGRLCHDALESHSFRRQLPEWRERYPRGARRALPHLLAADFCFHLPARLLGRGRRGSHAGFLCHDSGT